MPLTPRELVLRRHSALHQLGLDEAGAQAVGVFGVVLPGKHETTVSAFGHVISAL